MIHIHAPRVYGRTIRRCTACRRRRRFLVCLYEYDSAEWICCGCGQLWSKEGWAATGKKRLESRRQTAREQWPQAKRLRLASRELADRVLADVAAQAEATCSG